MTRLVLVEWVDSRRPNPEWQRLDGWESDDLCRCASVGWAHETVDVVVLAPNRADVDTDDVQISGVIHIPRAAITRIVNLEEER